jgi:hypothetical protein
MYYLYCNDSKGKSQLLGKIKDEYELIETAIKEKDNYYRVFGVDSDDYIVLEIIESKLVFPLYFINV